MQAWHGLQHITLRSTVLENDSEKSQFRTLRAKRAKIIPQNHRFLDFYIFDFGGIRVRLRAYFKVAQFESYYYRRYYVIKDTISGNNQTVGYGVKSSKDTKSMESAQPLANHPLAIDAVLFSGGGPDGSYLVAAQARRKLGMNNTIFSLRIPEIGVLLHPKHPDTTMFTTSKINYYLVHFPFFMC